MSVKQVYANKKAVAAMSEAELLDVVRLPVITEKATFLSENGQYVFTVAPTATKEAVRRAVEEIFKVDVVSVQTLNQKGKVKRTKGRLGVRSDVKKAYVRLAPGSTIDLTAKIG